ncbi:unnamed protein product [Caenorhabditis auriculariae]|uniref:DNA-directed primase/polymerase protein n=1 Tax=Caenorhabditis auriculariae TaxID=2777116 RepID=A0A8S1HDL5_9PELO|nr:unnamed protein product [Caenorhabditis auriculariae]
MLSPRVLKRNRSLEDVENDPDISWVVDKKLKATSPAEKPSKELTSPIHRETLVEKSLGAFNTFPRQKEALEALQISRRVFNDGRIFSYEVGDEENHTGARNYVVTTLCRFWPYYSEREEAHMYELILENTPCRLYFDLEYSKETNPDADHLVVLNHFFGCVDTILDDMFLINVSKKNFLLLDSSNDRKFSCHAICHLPENLLFPSNTSMRPFIKSLSEELLKEPPIRLMNKDTKEITVMDSAVYSKNRNFRLFLSSKLGKTRALVLADYCTFYGIKKPTKREIFYDSLCVPDDFDRFKLLPVEVPSSEPLTATSSSLKFKEKEEFSNGSSPYPDLDDFMLEFWKLLEENGKPKSIIYYPANCRYCFNIRREHKSNGTYWTVDFEKREFYQKCFDPECRGTSSNHFPLPKFVTSIDKREEEEEEEDPEKALDKIRFFNDWDSLFEQ